jgi:hypothetical protein
MATGRNSEVTSGFEVLSAVPVKIYNPEERFIDDKFKIVEIHVNDSGSLIINLQFFLGSTYRLKYLRERSLNRPSTTPCRF